MPEALRALLVVFALSAAVLLAARPAACAVAIPARDYALRCKLWLALTALAFLAHNYWLFVAVASLLLLFAVAHEGERFALYLFLVFALPELNAPIPGFGPVNFVFNLSYPRLLALTVLLPAALVLLRRPEARRPCLPDQFLAAYLLLALGLQLSVDSATNTLRYAFYSLLDIALPYYVASRSLRSLRDFREALMSFAVAAMVLSAIAVFESAKHWLLYVRLDDILDAPWGFGGNAYLLRDDSLRAVATAGQPIALGFVIAVAMGFFLFLARSLPGRGSWWAGLALLAAGLLAPLSRGPWLGAVVGLAVFAASDRKPLSSLLRLVLPAAAALALILASPWRDAFIDRLPFIGSIDADTIAYRQRLIDVSLDIVRQHPFLGSTEFLGQMEELRQGQGIIDIVNTYLGIALTTGLAGLSLFLAVFAGIVLRIYRGMRALPPGEAELHLLGRALLATLAGILTAIATVSSISVIPVVYWSVAGIGFACAELLQARRAPQPAPLPAAPAGRLGWRA